jgi:hypothetical protein
LIAWALLPPGIQPSDTALPGVPGAAFFIFEAERAVVTPPFVSQPDGNAGNARYMVVPNGTAVGVARLSFPFTAHYTGDHYLWLRVRTPSANDDSVKVQLDDGPAADWLLPSSAAWTWVRFNTRLNITTPGQHTLHLPARENGTEIDRAILTSDPAYTPHLSAPAP